MWSIHDIPDERELEVRKHLAFESLRGPIERAGVLTYHREVIKTCSRE